MALIAYDKTNNGKLQNIYPKYFDTTNPKYILIDNMYISTFIVSDYSKEMEGGFLDKLLFLRN